MIEDVITAVLEGAELWTQLRQFQNEMVVGPTGRYVVTRGSHVLLLGDTWQSRVVAR